MDTARRPQASPTREQQSAGRTFRMMREVHRLSLRELAALVGVSPSHLSRIESGERAAGPELTLRLCDVIANLPAPPEAKR
jgi:transcriptional regulator with XRE-family HTH domain